MPLRPILRLLPALLFLPLLAPPAAMGQASAARTAACAPARVGLSDLGYGSYLDGNGYGGIAVDIIAEMQRRSGCRFSYEWYPHSRLYLQFASGQLELTSSSLRTPERDLYGTWLPYSTSQFFLLLTNDAAGKFSSLAEFVDHSTARLNVTRGVYYPPAAVVQMMRLQKLGRLEYVSDYGVVFKKILAGRAEGTLASPVIHVLYTHRFQLEGKLVTIPYAESPRSVLGLYVSKRLVPPQTTALYAATLRAMVIDGTVQKIYSRYLGDAVTHQVFSGGLREILDAAPPLPPIPPLPAIPPR